MRGVLEPSAVRTSAGEKNLPLTDGGDRGRGRETLPSFPSSGVLPSLSIGVLGGEGDKRPLSDARVRVYRGARRNAPARVPAHPTGRGFAAPRWPEFRKLRQRGVSRRSRHPSWDSFSPEPPLRLQTCAPVTSGPDRSGRAVLVLAGCWAACLVSAPPAEATRKVSRGGGIAPGFTRPTLLGVEAGKQTRILCANHFLKEETKAQGHPELKVKSRIATAWGSPSRPLPPPSSSLEAVRNTIARTGVGRQAEWIISRGLRRNNFFGCYRKTSI